MKINFKKPAALLLIVFAMLITASCKKSVGTASGSYTWNYESVNYTAAAQRAWPAGNGYYYIDGALGNIVAPEMRIALKSLTVNAYSLPDTAVAISYREPTTGSFLGPASGTLNITSRLPDAVSGNFSAVMASGSILTGTFSDVPVQ